jgi:DNA-binding NarL/FixJ family response regulator
LNAAYQLAGIALARGQYDAAQSHAETACRMAEEAGDDWFLAYCLNELGRAARAQGDYTLARRHFQSSYALREAMADPEGMALAMVNLGDVALRQEQVEQAGRFFERSVAIYHEIYDRGGLATAYHGLGRTAMYQGDYETAQQHLREALEISAEIGFTTLLLAVLASAGEFLLRTGRAGPGLRLLATVQAHPAADHGIKMALRQQWRHYQETLSAVQIEAAKAAGMNDLQEAVALALAELAAPLPVDALSLAPTAPDPGGPPAHPLVEPLTERELEVVRLLAQGLTNRQIAEELSVVVGTVKAHTNRIYGKLDVANRVQAARRARELGLLR